MDEARRTLAMADELAAAARYEEAIAAYERAMALEPGLEGYRFVVGELLFELQRYPAAAMAFELVTRHLPDDARGWEALGRALHMNGDVARAAKVLDHACALAPSWPDAAYHAALAYAELGDDAVAEARLRDAIARDPRFLEAARDEGLLERFPNVAR